MSSAGMTFFPDPELEDFVRSAAKLPAKSEEAMMLQAQADAQRMAQQAMGGMEGDPSQGDPSGAEGDQGAMG
jgi:hypothetical protein